MRHAKSGNWWDNNPQRALANNSVAYTEKPDSVSFMREWMALVESGSGERGVFNREASKNKLRKVGGVILTMILAPIHAVKLFLDLINSVILQRLLYEPLTRLKTWSERSDVPQYLGRSKARSQSFHICERCGSEIPKKNDCSVCHSQG